MHATVQVFQIVGASLALALTQSANAEPVPPAAAKVIAEVHRAAENANLAGVRKHMVAEFNWSFGGDASAEQAIDAWRKQPGYMRHLARVTNLKCVHRKDRIVECPTNAGTNFRAGFQQSEGTWKMVYFVEGD